MIPSFANIRRRVIIVNVTFPDVVKKKKAEFVSRCAF